MERQIELQDLSPDDLEKFKKVMKAHEEETERIMSEGSTLEKIERSLSNEGILEEVVAEGFQEYKQYIEGAEEIENMDNVEIHNILMEYPDFYEEILMSHQDILEEEY